MSPISCLLRLTTRVTGWPGSSPVVVRHRASGWYVAPEGATHHADAAVRFDNEVAANEFVDSYTCEPAGFEVLAVDAAERAA